MIPKEAQFFTELCDVQNRHRAHIGLDTPGMLFGTKYYIRVVPYFIRALPREFYLFNELSETVCTFMLSRLRNACLNMELGCSSGFYHREQLLWRDLQRVFEKYQACVRSGKINDLPMIEINVVDGESRRGLWRTSELTEPAYLKMIDLSIKDYQGALKSMAFIRPL
jgi:hypothetical protein